MSAEFQHRSGRGDSSSRLQLLYESSGGINRELPFIIGVLADLAGNHPKRSAVTGVKWFDLDRDDFDERIERIEPTLNMNVSGLGEFTLRFRELDDFGPVQIAAQVPALTDLIHARRRIGQFAGNQDELDRLLADLTGRSAILQKLSADLQPAKPAAPATADVAPASGASLLDHILGQLPAVELAPSGGDTIDQLIRHAAMSARSISRDVQTTVDRWIAALDRNLSEGVRSILHHSDFRALEATWRGLGYLVRHTETNAMLKIRVLDVKREDMEGHHEVIFETIVVQPYHEAGEPFGLLVAGFDFGPSDLKLLQQLARIGQAAHAPLVAAAMPALLGLERFADLMEVEELAPPSARWRAFRDSVESRYVILTVPRVMARRPYGKEHTEVEEFSFEELADGSSTDCCWMSAAWCYAAIVANAFAHDGWFTRTSGLEGGGKVAGLPAFPVKVDDESVFMGPTEIAIPGQEAETLSHHGFVPLVMVRRSDTAFFATTRSCRKPVGEDDIALGDVRHLLGISRFAHYLLTIGHMYLSATAEELSAILNDWLSRYTASNPDQWNPATQPFLNGMVKVKPLPGTPGINRIVAALVYPVSETSAPTLVINLGTILMQ